MFARASTLRQIVWGANRPTDDGRTTSRTCARAVRSSCRVRGHSRSWPAGLLREARRKPDLVTLRNQTIRRYPARARVLVLCALQPSQHGNQTPAWKSPIVQDFRSVVADRRIRRHEKDLIADKAMRGVLTVKEIVRIFNCMKKGNYVNEELLEHCADRVFECATHVKHLSSIELGMAIQSLAVMYAKKKSSFRSFRPLLGALVEECFERERGRKKEFDEQGIANVVYALGLVVKRNAGLAQDMQLNDLIDIILMKLIKGDGRAALHKCTGQGLANIVYGLALLGYSNARVLDALGEEIRQAHRLKNFNEQELSNIVYGFGLLEYQNEAVLEALGAEVSQPERLKEFNEQGLANIVYAFALLMYQNEAVLDALGAEMRQPERLRRFQEQGLANIVYGFGLLKYYDEEVLDALADEIRRKERLKGFKEQEFSNIVYGFALLQYYNGDVLDVLGQEMSQKGKLKTFKDQGLANIVYGLALLGYSNARVLDALGEEIGQAHRLKKFKEQELSNIVYGFGLLKHCNEEVLDALGAEMRQAHRLRAFKEQGLSNVVYGLGLLQYYNEAVLEALGEEIQQTHRLSKFTEQDISSIVYGLGLLRYKNESVLEALGEEIKQSRRLKAFKEQGLSATVYGFGLLGYHNEAVLEALSNEIKQADRLEKFKEQELSNIVYGLALLTNRCGNCLISNSTRQLLESMASEIKKKERMEEFSSQGLSNIAWGLGELRYLDASLMDFLIDRFLVLAKSEGGADKRAVTMLVCACAVLNIPHAEFLQFVNAWMEKNLIGVEDAREITNLTWGLAVLRFLFPEQFQRICAMLVRFGVSGLKHEECGQLLQAYSFARCFGSLQLDSQASTLIENARMAYKAERGSATSQFETDVSRTLGELGIEHKLQYEIEEVCMVADILVEGDSHIVIEADGPTHYTVNECEGKHCQVGGTIFRNRILQGMGFKVLCIPFFEWAALSYTGKRKWLQEKLYNMQST